MQRPTKFLVPILACLSLLGPSAPARADTSDALNSVVSVLPVWPGQPQGGAGAAPGSAPEGSGIAIRDGVVATAWHVIAPADRIDVRLADGRILPARVIAHDVASDIAVLAVEADLIPFALDHDPQFAQSACAIGNAFGLGLSLTCGVVSATGVSNAGFNPVEDFIQTDAAINPGVSGGALVGTSGALIGMVSSIFASEGDGNIGVNFAVSADLLRRVTDALLDDGGVRYADPGWGLEMPDRATLARIAAPRVALVAEGGPAAAAGIRTGDLILGIGEREVQSPRDAIAALALIPQSAPGYEVRIERDGAPLVLPVAMQDVPEAVADAAPEILGDCPHPAPVCLGRQAVFPISSFDPVGSATRIAADLLVTNRHVVGDRRDAVVHTPDGPRGGRVVASAYGGDLVLLEVPGLPEEGHLPDTASGDPAPGEFYVVGADVTREEIRVFEPGGLIAGPAEGADLARIHVRARMQPGVSGGALLNADGDLVGIAVGGGDGRFEAIPMSDVQALLSLRGDATAEDVTGRLGAAFAACAGAMDAAASGSAPTSALDDIVVLCEAGNNHGQLLEAGRILAGAGAFDGAAALHGAAVRQVPNSINARMSLLVSLQLGARFQEMTEHARWLMGMAPDDPQALRFAIQSGVWGDDADLAEAGYQALLKADPVQAQAARRFIDNAPPAPGRR
ncbi:MAG: trypsin-like peptidase domain-containing protein [Pseudomonadota bacterium]